jgi:hypothetical protein
VHHGSLIPSPPLNHDIISKNDISQDRRAALESFEGHGLAIADLYAKLSEFSPVIP